MYVCCAMPNKSVHTFTACAHLEVGNCFPFTQFCTLRNFRFLQMVPLLLFLLLRFYYYIPFVWFSFIQTIHPSVPFVSLIRITLVGFLMRRLSWTALKWIKFSEIKQYQRNAIRWFNKSVRLVQCGRKDWNREEEILNGCWHNTYHRWSHCNP